MARDRVAENLAAVENRFHSEARNEIEAALAMFADDIVWEAPALNGLDRAFSGKEAVAESYRALFALDAQRQVPFLQRFATEVHIFGIRDARREDLAGARLRHGTCRVARWRGARR